MIALCAALLLVGEASAQKVQICKIPPGNPANRRTITVDASAVRAHLATGSTMGPCVTACSSALQCNDNDLCTADTCVAGLCQNVPVSCDDQNACTLDSCSPTAGCVYAPAPNGAPCDDGRACTAGDSCAAGVCAGSPVQCAGDSCHTAACAPQTGACVLTPISVDDNNVCTVDSCGPAGPQHAYIPSCCQADADCPSANPCARGQCSAAHQCVYTALLGLYCDDQDPCTHDDTCNALAVCAGTPTLCADQNPCTLDRCNPLNGACEFLGSPALAGAPCDDGVACTAGDACNSNAQCTGYHNCSIQSPCAASTCDLASGLCQVSTNDALCDDGVPCTVDSCSASGGCLHDASACACIANTTDARCNDQNPCTNDFCGPAYTCLHNSVGTDNASCTDGNACTLGDVCSAGLCVPGAAKSCDDQNPCTLDSCDPQSGSCSSAGSQSLVGAPCNDGVACTAGDECNAQGTCAGSSSCVAPVSCAGSVCDLGSGQCVVTASDAVCDDGIPCTLDRCEIAHGCVHNTSACACTADPHCDDQNPCTRDYCAPDLTCAHNASGTDGAACSDGNPCTLGDSCSAGLCFGGAPKSCDDQDPCTLDACDTLSGDCHSAGDASLVGAQCTDGLACTSGDACTAQGTCAGSSNCASAFACVGSSCDSLSGQCQFSTNGALCDDGIPCTLDSCTLGGGCAHDASGCECLANTTDPRCNDQNPCTNDFCGPAYACLHNSVGTDGVACTDGNACTIGDVCASGTCVSGAAKSCDDQNPCTLDSCDPQSGSCSSAGSQALAGALCNDGVACTAGDECNAQGICAGTSSCTSNVGCAQPSCDLASGACVLTANSALCDDGVACTIDSCSVSGGCVHDASQCPCLANTADSRCNDGNACTDDFCTSSYACISTAIPNGAACSDGNACTAGDTCAAGVCVPGAAVNCDDGDFCTIDTCSIAGGCQHQPQVCMDNDICTADVCVAGVGCQYPVINPAFPTMCGNACVNLESDSNNCGACGNVCVKAYCSLGVCRPSYRVFVTNTTYLTNITVDGAVEACVNASASANLNGTFTPYISTTYMNASDRIRDGRYERLDGVIVAQNLTDLTDGSLLAPIRTNEFGVLVSRSVMTSTRRGVLLNRSNLCYDLTVSALLSAPNATALSATGASFSASSSWESASNTIGCSSNGRFAFYCFEI